MKFLTFLLWLLPVVALAQPKTPVVQTGVVTPGHLYDIVTNGVAGDGGPATPANGTLTGVGVVNSGIGVCDQNLPAAQSYTSLCLGYLAGAPTIFLIGPGAPQSLNFNLNGVTFSLPGNLGGGVLISGTPSAGQVTEWAGPNSITGVTATGSGAPVLANSPNLTGIPTAPTAAAGTNTSQIATTAFITGGLTITPTASTLNQAFNVTQTLAGTTSADCTTGVFSCANLFYVASDSVAAAVPSNDLDEWQFRANFGGSTLTGARQAMDVYAIFTAPSSPSNTNKGYDASAFYMIAEANDGGTAPSTLDGKGSFFGTNAVVVANSSATNLLGVVGQEVDNQCLGCTTAIRVGVSVVNFGNTPGFQYDAAFHVGSATAGGGWGRGFELSDFNGQPPLATTGCVLCLAGAAYTIGTGIDLSLYTITGNFLLGPNGFKVGGDGSLEVTQTAGFGNGVAVTGGGISVVGGFLMNPPPTGTPATYACFTSAGFLISSASPC